MGIWDMTKEDMDFVLQLHEMWRPKTDTPPLTMLEATTGYGGMTFEEFVKTTGNLERFKLIQKRLDASGTAKTE